MLEACELASYIVTVIGLPIAIGVFFYEQRKERENEEEEQYQHLSDAYNDFLKVVLDHADLQLRTHEPLPNATPDQRERMLVIFDMLISLFERAYLVAYNDDLAATERDFASLAAWELGAVAIQAAVERAGVGGDAIDEVLMGNCLMAGQGQAPARQALAAM